MFLVWYRSCLELGPGWPCFYSRNIPATCIVKLKLKYLSILEQQWFTCHVFKAQKLHGCSHRLVVTLGCHDWYLLGYRYPLMFVFLNTLESLCTVWYTLTLNAIFHTWSLKDQTSCGVSADPGAMLALSSRCTINVCILGKNNAFQK